MTIALLSKAQSVVFVQNFGRYSFAPVAHDFETREQAVTGAPVYLLALTTNLGDSKTDSIFHSQAMFVLFFLSHDRPKNYFCH